LWMDQDEISAVHRWSSRDTSYQVSIQLVSEEKIKMCKVNGRQTTDNGRQVMTKARIAFEARWPKKGINLFGRNPRCCLFYSFLLNSELSESSMWDLVEHQKLVLCNMNNII
jgi:hypothetical protein